MKVVILAGGLGTRLSEETVVKPKPMEKQWSVRYEGRYTGRWIGHKIE